MVFIICLRLLFCEWQILGEFEICWIGINFQIGKLLLTSFDLVGDLQQPSWNIALDEVQPTFYKQPTLIKRVARTKDEGFFCFNFIWDVEQFVQTGILVFTNDSKFYA